MMDDLWIVLPHLGAGGAQKVALLAASHFASLGHSVRVLTLHPGHPVQHRLPLGVIHEELCRAEDLLHPWLRDSWNRSFVSRCRRFVLTQCFLFPRRIAGLLIKGLAPWLLKTLSSETNNALGRFFIFLARLVGGKRYRYLRKKITAGRPRRVLSLLTRTNILCCLAAWDQPLQLVVSERNDPSLQHLDRVWSLMRLYCYTRADVVTANTEGVLSALKVMGEWKRLALLPNPLPPAVKLGNSIGVEKRQRQILSVARLVPQKGLDILIAAFATIPVSLRTGWTLSLVGEGPERFRLEEKVESLGISSFVCSEGFSAQPLEFMARAAIFALPSRFEGMPNALLEAMAMGLPVIVSDASPGPLEMVADGVNGLVVPTENIAAMAEALKMLMRNPELRNELGDEARRKLRELQWDVLEPLWRSVLDLPAKL